MQRSLIYVPIIHDVFRDQFFNRNRFPEVLVKAYTFIYDLYWDGIEEVIGDRQIDKIYQDSFYNEDQREILLSDGSRNSETLVDLVGRGGELMLTDHPDLGSKNVFPATNNLFLLFAQAKKRDKYIAERIYSTLNPGETGILFIGADHNIDHYLEQYGNFDIEFLNGPSFPLSELTAYIGWEDARQDLGASIIESLHTLPLSLLYFKIPKKIRLKLFGWGDTTLE